MLIGNEEVYSYPFVMVLFLPHFCTLFRNQWQTFVKKERKMNKRRVIHSISLSTYPIPSLYPATLRLYLRVTNFSPLTSQRPTSDRHYRNQLFQLYTRCFTSCLLTWMQNIYVVILMSVSLAHRGLSQNVYVSKWSKPTSKRKLAMPQERGL